MWAVRRGSCGWRRGCLVYFKTYRHVYNGIELMVGYLLYSLGICSQSIGFTCMNHYSSLTSRIREYLLSIRSPHQRTLGFVRLDLGLVSLLSRR